MRITYVCDEYPPTPHGGIGTYVRNMAHSMVEAGHSVAVVGLGTSPGRRCDGGVEVFTLPMATVPHAEVLVNRLRLHRWLSAHARRGATDVIEVPDYQGWMPFRFPHCPVIVRLHLSSMAIAAEAGQRCPVTIQWAERSTLRQHPNWTAVSKYILGITREAFRVEPASCPVVYNSVSVPEPSPLDAPLPERFILFAGAVSERKGALVLAQACRAVLAAHPDVHLVYVGVVTDIGTEPGDVAIRRTLGPDLSDRVHFLGRLRHAQTISVMRAATVFAFPSRLESFGLAPLEAMACGVPVIYSATGPGPELVDDGVTGLLVDPHDADMLAGQIRLVLGDPALAARLSQAAFAEVERRFSLGQARDETIRAYERVIHTGVTRCLRRPIM